MSTRWSVIPVCCALLGLPARGDDAFPYAGAPLREPAVVVVNRTDEIGAVTGAFRLASYNIEHFQDGIGDEPTRTPEIARRHAQMAAANLQKIQPDVLVIQEIENETMVNLLNDAFEKPFPVAYVAKFGTGATNDLDNKLNMAVLSRFALEEVGELDFGPLEGPGRPTRGILRFVLDLGEGHKLLVYSMHLKSNWGHKPRNIAQRQHALKILRDDAAAKVAQYPDVTWEIVALGDTNVDPDSPSFADDPSFEPMAEWIDLWRGRPLEERMTWATRYGDPAQEFPPVAFDRFFISKSLQAEPWKAHEPNVLQEGSVTSDITVLPGEGDHISDHYPIYLDIER